MGITTMKRWTAMVALVVLAVSAASLQAQKVKLLDYTNTFRYNQVDNLNTPTNAWTARVYTDTTGNWLGGPALLAYEDNGAITPLVRTPLQDPRTYTPSGHAVYFRAHFNSFLGTRAFLTVTNRIDDGAVLYLNGLEIQRINCAANPVGFTSLSTAGSTENVESNFVYYATNLVNGDNVLAAIVVQSAVDSSDTVYGSIIWGESGTIVITNQPDSLSVAINDSAAFTVGASGANLFYQWQYRATTNVAFANLAGATATTYNIPLVISNNAGFYQVIVSNLASVVTSAVATLSVTADNFPPDLLSAVATEATNRLILSFDENVLRETATNLNNYLITMVGTTNRLIVTNALLNGKLVQLSVAPSWTTNVTNFLKWTQEWTTNGSNYIVTMNNICDSLGNVIRPNTGIGVSFWKDDVIPPVSTWNFVNADNATLQNLNGQNWQAYNYNEYTNNVYEGGQWYIWDPSFGSIGTDAFYFSLQNADEYALNKANLNSLLNIGYPTYYFRSRFVLTNVNSSSRIKLHYFVDDGAVFYLNGVEIYRINVPLGPTSYGTLASGQVPPATVRWQVQEIAVTNLVSGTNVMAVELHPASLDPIQELGIIFQMSLDVTVAPLVPAPPNVSRPDLRALASVLPISVATNTTFNCSLTATNAGQTNATNVQFTATFPNTVSIVTVPVGCANVVDTNGVSTLTCSTNTSIPTNGVFTKVVQARTGTNTGTAVIRLTIGQTPADSLYLNNTNNTTLTITAAVAAPDIAVGTTVLPAVVGTTSNLNFTFSVTNLGATAASSVVAVYTNLPAGLSIVTLPVGCTLGSGIVTCTIGTMNAGTVQTKTLVVASAVAGTLTNRVVVSSTPADTGTANNVAASTGIVSVKPVLGSFKALGTTNISMTVTSVVGVTYVMDYKALLTSPVWTPVLTNAGTGGTLTLTPPVPSPVSPTRFYRLRAQ